MQYVTKDLLELKKDVQTICKNMAPLLGCKVDGIGWAPFTGVNVCKALSTAGLTCSNVSNDTVNNGLLVYKFTSSLSTEASGIWKKVLAYDSSVLNSSYTMYIANMIPAGSQVTEKLRLTSQYCIYTDSTIFDAAFGNDNIRLTPIYQRICHILLSCFTLRYFLFEYTQNNIELNTMEVNETIIDRIIENIDYVKFVMSQNKSVEQDYMKSLDYTRQHLTVLRKNLMMIRPNILQYIKS